jgi:hypothetical protein
MQTHTHSLSRSHLSSVVVNYDPVVWLAVLHESWRRDRGTEGVPLAAVGFVQNGDLSQLSQCFSGVRPATGEKVAVMQPKVKVT